MSPIHTFIGFLARKTFSFNGGTVGEFRTWLWPKRDGVYRYMPYRSGSHYRMYVQLRKTGSARCYYQREGRKVWFFVVGHPKYARLQLQKFEFELPLDTTPKKMPTAP